MFACYSKYLRLRVRLVYIFCNCQWMSTFICLVKDGTAYFIAVIKKIEILM